MERGQDCGCIATRRIRGGDRSRRDRRDTRPQGIAKLRRGIAGSNILETPSCYVAAESCPDSSKGRGNFAKSRSPPSSRIREEEKKGGSRDLGTWTANLNEGGEWKGGFLVESISRWIRFPSFVIVASLTLASWDVGGRLDLHARGNNTIGAEERSEGCFVRIRASGMETETGRSQRTKERTRGKARAHDDLRDEKYECLSDFLSSCRLDSTKLSF